MFKDAVCARPNFCYNKVRISCYEQLNYGYTAGIFIRPIYC